jgi:hypothetical protein
MAILLQIRIAILLREAAESGGLAKEIDSIRSYSAQNITSLFNQTLLEWDFSNPKVL